MPHSAAPQHTVYPAIPMDRFVHAQCYACGTAMWAEYLIWIAHPTLQGYLGLCASCYGEGHRAVAQLRAAHAPPEEARSQANLIAALPHVGR